MEARRRLDRILESDFTRDLEAKPIDEIRMMKSDCGEEEALLSYERRLLHGRMAILRAELQRRAGGEAGSLVDALPAILADERGPSRGSLPMHDPQLTFDQPRRRVTKLVSDDTLARLNELTEDEITSYIAVLEEAEREISETRHAIHQAIDAINRELARRYRSGEVDPGDLLSHS